MCKLLVALICATALASCTHISYQPMNGVSHDPDQFERVQASCRLTVAGIPAPFHDTYSGAGAGLSSAGDSLSNIAASMGNMRNCMLANGYRQVNQ